MNILPTIKISILVTLFVPGLVCSTPTCVQAESPIKTYRVESEYQNGVQPIRVLVPDDYDAQTQYRVLYVLPVERGVERRYGDGLDVLRQIDAHNRHQLILVQASFEKEPWFGDHASDLKTRQASYLQKFVVPLIERCYSTLGTLEGRLLFGFSKSGWGAISLILSAPEFYGYAASWDAPLMFQRFHFRMEPIYGAQEQLDRYRPDLLVVSQKRFFQDRARLVITGEQGWGRNVPAPGGGSHTIEAHRLMIEHDVKHHYDKTLVVAHRWHAGWVEPTLAALMKLATADDAPAP